jgi:hypothetical protein
MLDLRALPDAAVAASVTSKADTSTDLMIDFI